MEQRTHSNAGTMTAYHRAYYQDVRRPSILEYVGGTDPRCAQCGSREGLETDHVDPDQKSFNISRNMTVNNPLVQAELDKCQLLCSECHLAKSMDEKRARDIARNGPDGFRHGSMYGWMKAKCSCSTCGQAKREWNDARNDTRRRASTNPRGRYGRESRHGERLHYKRGCRCDECKAASAAYSRRLYASSKTDDQRG